MKNSFIFLLLSLLVTLTAGCNPVDDTPGEEGEPVNKEVRGYKVSPDTLFMKVGEVVSLTGKVDPEELTSMVRASWESKDESIIKVDDKGNVTAVDYGYSIVEASIDFVFYGFINRTISNKIPVYVSFGDNPIPNPEEMYAKWLGNWDLSGKYKPPTASEYNADYAVSITELEPMESYRLTGWEKFNDTSAIGHDLPGKPLYLTARFDRKSGHLVFIRNKAANTDYDIVQTPYWGYTMGDHTGYYKRYDYPEDAVIAYARLEKETEAVVHGAYNNVGGVWFYHLGMGFSTQAGNTMDGPMFFPIKMYRLKDVPVQEVILSSSSMVMEVGTETTLSVQWHPTDAMGFRIEWSSSNPETVTVEDGHLKALSPGHSDITVTLGDVSATCEVTVKKPFIRFGHQILHDELCKLWDADGDGELCFEEAAAATYICSFNEIWMQTKFDELKYFTSLKEIEARCFYFTGMNSITFPASIEKIGDEALDGNSLLRNVTLLGTPPQIGNNSLGFVLNQSSLCIWVPDEYYDLYLEEAKKEGSQWAKYLPRLFRASERKDPF